MLCTVFFCLVVLGCFVCVCCLVWVFLFVCLLLTSNNSYLLIVNYNHHVIYHWLNSFEILRLSSFSNIVLTSTVARNFVSFASIGLFLLAIFSLHMNGMEYCVWNEMNETDNHNTEKVMCIRCECFFLK